VEQHCTEKEKEQDLVLVHSKNGRTKTLFLTFVPVAVIHLGLLLVDSGKSRMRGKEDNQEQTPKLPMRTSLGKVRRCQSRRRPSTTLRCFLCLVFGASRLQKKRDRGTENKGAESEKGGWRKKTQ
jgi:hypothetical protein